MVVATPFTGGCCTLTWLSYFWRLDKERAKKDIMAAMIANDKGCVGAFLAAITPQQMESPLKQVLEELHWEHLYTTHGPQRKRLHGQDMAIWICDLIKHDLKGKCATKLKEIEKPTIITKTKKESKRMFKTAKLKDNIIIDTKGTEN